MSFSKEISILTSLFKSRTDIFAKRWEKAGKSAYSPVYKYDPYRYSLHKRKGGTFNAYSDKELEPLSENQIAKHLSGDHFIGIYPLLADNTSWFIAADFDKEKWVEECRSFLKVCEESKIPAYLERSRSGKGGHVWIFFEKPYPAFKSRRIFISLLEKTGSFSKFDKSSSFDRLFPNQDKLSGKGFGNLIAGRIDITAQDDCGNKVIIELKATEAKPDVIAQTLAYGSCEERRQLQCKRNNRCKRLF